MHIDFKGKKDRKEEYHNIILHEATMKEEEEDS
jgi:hypothetical protein